jgi:hypothetical protein
VVGDAAAGDAAADDHDPRLVLHRPPLVRGPADDRSILPAPERPVNANAVDTASTAGRWPGHVGIIREI